MHILSLTQPLPVGGSIGTLTPGDWLLHDQNAFELALMAERDTARLENRGIAVFGHPKSNRILLMRSGAIGDLLFLTPNIKAYREANPDCDIYLCCRKEHFPLFENTDTFEGLVPYPLETAKVVEYRIIHSLENVMETAHDTHATDAFAEALDVTVTDYKPIYVVTEEEKSIARVWLRSDRPAVGIQVAASTKNRNYPLTQWAPVIDQLEARGWQVLIFGLPGQVPPLPKELQKYFIQDMSLKGLSFRETAALLSLCTAFVGVDSSLLHLCHALDVPAIGLYGPFSWETRTAKAPLTHALTGEGDCKNCRWHVKNGMHFPPKACRQEQVCSVLASISPDRIIAKVDAFRE